MTISYTNGNREIVVSEQGGKFYVGSDVFDGVKWQYGHRKEYKTLATAKKAAEKIVAQISQGWTKYPEWTITNG